jgi:ABC-type uncharacterized transport system ATPase subunit
VVVAGRAVWTGTVDDLRRRSDVSLLTTSDDAGALALAAPGVDVTAHEAGGLRVAATTQALDAYVLALAGHGIAVRSLAREALSLEQAFLELAA